MAEAATKQLDWLEAQFWITLAEIGALILTLAATAWAAIAASRSAIAAQQSAALATRVDRPYLVLSGLRLTGLANGGDVGLPDQKNHLVQVESSVKNLGSRIAFIKAVAMETNKAGQNRDPRSARPSAEWKGPHGLAPNEELSGKVPVGLFSMKPPEIRDIQNSRQPFYVFGFIRYGDIHGTVRRTGFAYRFYPSLLARDGYTDDGTFIGVGPDSYWYDIEEPTEKPRKRPWWKRLKRPPNHAENSGET
jgi:hypothetical protein